MGISDKNINFRASETTLKELKDIQNLFNPFLPDRSSTIRWIVRKFWEVLFTSTNLAEALIDWQVFSGKTMQHNAAQMRIKFPPHEDAVSFFPKIGNYEVSE